MRRRVSLIFGLCFLVLFSIQAGEASLCHYVNPLQGSDSDVNLSSGNTYPAVAMPWGMNFWTPQTGKMGNGWQYTYKDSTICGFKQTHQPSPWINDYGCFSIMPGVGEPRIGEKERASRFSHDNEVSLPHYYKVKLDKSNITTEITPSERGAIFRIEYPRSKESHLMIDCYNQQGFVKILPDENKIIGYSRFYAKNNNATLPENFATYFVITISKKITSYSTWKGKKAYPKQAMIDGKQVGCYVRFDTDDEQKLELKVASSFISMEQAQWNFDNEISSFSFAQQLENAERRWNEYLGRIKVEGGTEEEKRTFYTALYRTMLFPRQFHETNKAGDNVHYSPFTGKTEKGVFYTDNGFWDTFRAVHPFFTIMYPSLSSRIMQGLESYYREGGWIPEWFSPGYKNCMIGQNSASVIADAYLKGIRGFDIELLWQGLVKGANNEGPNATGRDGVSYYNELGYIPYNVGKKESVSKTMEYAYNDYCLSELAKALQKPKDTISLFAKRAFNYANVFDASTNFVRPKDDKGNWEVNSRPDTWGGSFTEGSAWHWTWSVFHDPAGLIRLMGGEKNFISRLDSVFVAKPTFDHSNYKRVIHEMTEMVNGKMGQYAHGNQPIQHAIYLYNYAGVPYKTQKWVRYTMKTQYHSGVNGLCGDEDNGQTSAWYVFSALGFYPVCPGSQQYVIGSPLFTKSTLMLENGKSFTVNTINNSEKNIYIQSARLNGKKHNRSYLTHSEIMAGGILEFVMGDQPNLNWGMKDSERPASFSLSR